MSGLVTQQRTMARYNRWANRRLSAAVAALSEDDYYAERGAFFGSIHGTLNHLLVGDRLWLGRIERAPYKVSGLNAIVCADRAAFLDERAAEDERLIRVVDGMDADALASVLDYKTTSGASNADPLWLIVTHMFNHATHHRAQVHTLLSQVPADPPPLDLIYFIRENGA